MGIFGAEKRHEGKYPLIDPDHDLLIELAALRQRRSIAEIVDIEKFSSAFRRGSNDIRSKIFDGLDRIVHIEADRHGRFQLEF